MTSRSGNCKGSTRVGFPVSLRAGKRLENVTWTTPGRFTTMFNPRERRSRSLFRERRRTLARRRLRVEALEPHVLLSTFMVTQPFDDGTPHTLSWAIEQVNNDANDSAASPDEIDFSIATGPQTLTEYLPVADHESGVHRRGEPAGVRGNAAHHSGRQLPVTCRRCGR